MCHVVRILDNGPSSVTYYKWQQGPASSVCERPHEKTNNMHRGKQKRGSAVQLQISSFVFVTQIVQSLVFFSLKIQASSLLLRLYRPLCVVPGGNPDCWFAHDTAYAFPSNVNVSESRLRV